MRIGAADQLLFDPRFLLHRLDLAAGRLIFLPTTRRLLAQASFLDGRTRIASGPEIACGLADALRHAESGRAEAPPNRFIFHVSFCGSTRLARIIDRPGRVLAMREPNVLVDLADWKAALERSSAVDPRVAPLARLACASLRSRWHSEEAVVVKPSNWVNNLIPELAASGAIRPLFVVMSRRAFLRAVFRGGRERLAFIARAAAHLASGRPSDEALLNAAISAASDPLGKVAHIAAFAHWLQHRRFRRTMDSCGWGSDHVVTFDQIERAPRAAAATAAAALDLDLSAEDLAHGVARTSERDAKQPDAAYSREERFEADVKIERLYGERIEAAVAWARDLLADGAALAAESDDDLAARQAG